MAQRTYRYTHRVTYHECTVGNHVYYARYLDILEAARGEFFRTLGIPFIELQGQGVLFPATECQLKYRAAARYDDVLSIEVWIAELRSVRVAFGYQITDAQGKLILEGETTHACTDATDKPMRIPGNVTEKLAEYVAAEGKGKGGSCH